MGLGTKSIHRYAQSKILGTGIIAALIYLLWWHQSLICGKIPPNSSLKLFRYSFTLYLLKRTEFRPERNIDANYSPASSLHIFPATFALVKMEGFKGIFQILVAIGLLYKALKFSHSPELVPNKSSKGLSLQLCYPCASLWLHLFRMHPSKVSICSFALVAINKAVDTRRCFPKTSL